MLFTANRPMYNSPPHMDKSTVTTIARYGKGIPETIYTNRTGPLAKLSSPTAASGQARLAAGIENGTTMTRSVFLMLERFDEVGLWADSKTPYYHRRVRPPLGGTSTDYNN